MEFFDKFCDPNTIHQLTLSEKMISSLIVTGLGMGVTFVGLIVIQYMMQITSRVVKSIEGNMEKAAANARIVPPPTQTVSQSVGETVTTENNQNTNEITEELVAVITAAVAAAMGTQTGNIVISDIRRVDLNTPAWAMAGRTEQLNSRF